MLKLIKCEFWKLKRKKFIVFTIISAFLFPIPITIIIINQMSENKSEMYLRSAYDNIYSMILGYGMSFLLPCILGIISALLFFIERDNDTFKNLKTIPISATKLVLTKLAVLFIFGIIFCIASTIASILCGFFTGGVYGITYKLVFSIITAFFLTAGSLPIVVSIVYFSSSYIFSVLICFFYSIFNLSMLLILGANLSSGMTTFLQCMPITSFLLWSSGELTNKLIVSPMSPEIEALLPSFTQTFISILLIAAISTFLIASIYNRRVK
ncbi:ABC transporter permease [Clostridioides difficile]